MKMLYKYPQREFPYRGLVEENARRKGDAGQPEFDYLFGVAALGGLLEHLGLLRRIEPLERLVRDERGQRRAVVVRRDRRQAGVRARSGQ